MFGRKSDLEAKDEVFKAMESDAELVSAGLVSKEKSRWLTQRGTKYAEAGKYEAAIIDLQEAIELNPNDITPYLPLASSYSKINQESKGIDLAKKALSLPKSESEIVPLPRIEICYQLAYYYLQKKDADNAKKYIEIARKVIRHFNEDKESAHFATEVQKRMKMKTNFTAAVDAFTVKLGVLSNIIDKGDFSAW